MLCKQKIDQFTYDRLGLQCGITVAILLLSASVAHAATNYYWMGGSGDFVTSGLWSPSGTPTSSDTCYLGDNGIAVVQNTGGTCLNLYVGEGDAYAGAGTININGANLTVGGTLTIGGVSTGSSYSGTVTQTSANTLSAGTVTFGGSTSGLPGGVYNLNNGTLSVGSITQGAYATTAAFNLGGGTLRWSGNSNCGLDMALTTGTSTIDTQSNSVTFTGGLSGTGALSKVGNGTLTIADSNNSYGGLTAVSAGTLAYGFNNALPASGAVTVNGGTLSLGGYSAALGSVTLTSGVITSTTGTLTSAAGFTQSGGNFQWGTSDFSVAPIGTGSYNMSGGTLSTGTADGNGDLYIGGGNATVGTATFTVSGGTTASVNIGGHTYIGYAAGSAGTLTLSQNATFNARILYVGRYGAGTVNQSAGLMATTHNVNIGANTNGNGVYNLSAGTLSIAGSGDLTLANTSSSTGLFYQTGGVVNTTGATTYGGLWVASYGIGIQTAQTATYHIVNGSVTTLGMLVGSAGGTGTFTQDGGVVTVTTAYTGGTYTGGQSDAIPLGNAALGYTAGSSGTYNLNGGVLNLDPSFGILVGGTGTGKLNVTGGVANLNGAAIFGAGTFTFSGGTVSNVGAVNMPVNLPSGGAGAVFQEDGSYAGTISGKVSGNGTLTKTGASKLTLSGANTYTGLTTVSAGTLELGVNAQAPVLGSGAAGADLQSQTAKLIFDYLSGSDLYLTIHGLLNNQIYASGVGVNPLICLDNTTTDTVTVEATVAGDANLDGATNGVDLDIVLSNYNKTGMTWAQGDFDGNGTVNGVDLDILLSNYNKTAAATAAAVPEPDAIVLLGVGGISLLGFARRQRRALSDG